MTLSLYDAPTPNGAKVRIMLAELGVEHDHHLIDLGKGEQFSAEFLRISPNNKIPGLVDTEGPDGQTIRLFESGAILIYLAQKYQSPLLPAQGAKHYQTLVWLMFQMGGLGPIAGNAHHFRHAAKEHDPYGIARFTDEVGRLYGVMDKRLSASAYLACDDYTIADLACFPWVLPYERQGRDLEDYDHLSRWFGRVAARPAVQDALRTLHADSAREEYLLDTLPPKARRAYTEARQD